MAKPGQHLIKACEVCGNEFRQTKSYQRYCSKKCYSSVWRKSNRAEIVRSRGVGLCPVCGKEFAKWRGRRFYCSVECAAIFDNERKKERARKLTGAPGRRWSLGREFVPRDICPVCGKRFYCPPARRRKAERLFCSLECRVKYMANLPDTFPRGSSRRGKGGKREDLGGLYVRSSWEANWARYLNFLVEHGAIRKWEYEPQTFEFVPIKKGMRFYTPDFRITNTNGSIEYHEVKGYMDDRSRTKLNRMAKYYPDIKVILVEKAEYDAVRKQVSGIIRGWE